MTFNIHYREMPHSERIRRECAKLADHLGDEFPEAAHVEFMLTQSGVNHETHVHVTGKHVDFASTATGRHPREAVHDAVSRIRRQLRKHHDKRIAIHRRTTRELE